MARMQDVAWVVAGATLLVAAIAMANVWPPQRRPGAMVSAVPQTQSIAAAAAAAAAEHSFAFLPVVVPPDFPFNVTGFGELLSATVARVMARAPGVRVADEDAVEVYRGWQGEPVVVASALGVRYVFVARLTGDTWVVRLDVAVTDARTGLVVFEAPFFADRDNAVSVPAEVAVALTLAVLNQLPNHAPHLP